MCVKNPKINSIHNKQHNIDTYTSTILCQKVIYGESYEYARMRCTYSNHTKCIITKTEFIYSCLVVHLIYYNAITYISVHCLLYM